jgi:hypothetical protein
VNLWSIPGGASLVDENIAKRKIENLLSPFMENVLGDPLRGQDTQTSKASATCGPPAWKRIGFQ